MKIRNNVTRPGVLALAMASIGVAGVAMTPSSAAAEDQGGPVVYLNRHGAPTFCELTVVAYDEGGNEIKSEYFYRYSCDGTLHLPQGTRTIEFHNAASVGDLGENNAYDYVNNVKDDWAYCLLASTTGQIYYTNASPKGGDCNGD